MQLRLASDRTRITSNSNNVNLLYFPDSVEISSLVYCLANTKDVSLTITHFLLQLSIDNCRRAETGDYFSTGHGPIIM